jgi:hypothetical protein
MSPRASADVLDRAAYHVTRDRGSGSAPLGWRMRRSFLRAFGTPAAVFPPDPQELIRGELFSVEAEG